MTKSLLYARVSSREQEETGYSLPSQEKLLQEYAIRKDFSIAKKFSISESASGRNQRKTFNEMLAYARKHNIKIIICEKVDRLTRNLKDAVAVDEWLEEDADRQVHLVKNSLVMHKNSRSQEKLNWGMNILIAKNTTDNLSEEVKKGQVEKIRQGWLPTKPPIGYKTTGERGHKIHIVDETSAPFARRMFEHYATGNYSLKKLTDVMYAEGLRTRGGNKVKKSRMHQLLSEPFYYGKNLWKGELSDGKQEPLISKELFDAVQQKLTRKIGSPQYRKHLPIFKAKITCEECGGTITWETQKGHWYGHHSDYAKYEHCTKKAYIRQEKVEEQLFPHFEKAVPKDKRVLKWLEKALKESHADEIEVSTSQRESLNRSFEKIQKRLEAVYVDKIDGKITIEFYEQRFKEYTAEKDAILESLNNLNRANTKYYEAGYAIHELACKAKDIYLSRKATPEEKRLLLSQMFSNLHQNKSRITPDYTLAFQFLIEWMPRINKSFEPTKNPAHSEALVGTAVTTPEKELLGSAEPRNNFRTSANPRPMSRFRETGVKSAHLLRDLDSNQDTQVQNLESYH